MSTQFASSCVTYQVREVLGRSTRKPDMSGECSTMPAQCLSLAMRPRPNREAKSTVATVPMLWPYRIMCSAGTPNLVVGVVVVKKEEEEEQEVEKEEERKGTKGRRESEVVLASKRGGRGA